MAKMKESENDEPPHALVCSKVSEGLGNLLSWSVIGEFRLMSK